MQKLCYKYSDKFPIFSKYRKKWTSFVNALNSTGVATAVNFYYKITLREILQNSNTIPARNSNRSCRADQNAAETAGEFQK